MIAATPRKTGPEEPAEGPVHDARGKEDRQGVGQAVDGDADR